MTHCWVWGGLMRHSRATCRASGASLSRAAGQRVSPEGQHAPGPAPCRAGGEAGSLEGKTSIEAGSKLVDQHQKAGQLSAQGAAVVRRDRRKALRRRARVSGRKRRSLHGSSALVLCASFGRRSCSICSGMSPFRAPTCRFLELALFSSPTREVYLSRCRFTLMHKRWEKAPGARFDLFSSIG